MPCKEFRVGVFFDGTGNSKEERATYSNVAKLHELYEVKKEKQHAPSTSSASAEARRRQGILYVECIIHEMLQDTKGAQI